MPFQPPAPDRPTQDPVRQRIRRYSYLICAVIFLSYLLVYFHRVCPSVLALEMQAAFGVGGTLLGVLGSAYFYPYGLMQFPVGLLADSWGPRKTVSFFLVLAAAGSVLMGLSPGLGWAVGGRVLVGVGVSTVFVCNFKLLTEWFSAREMVQAGGIFMAVGGLGVLVASTPLAWLSDLFGWQKTLILVGLVTLAMAGLVFVFVRDHPREKGWPGVRPAIGRAETTPASLLGGMKSVLCSARLWPISAWAFFNVGLIFALGSMWSVPYLQQVYGMPKTQAAGIQVTFALGLILGSPGLSFLANRLGRRPVLRLCSLLLFLASLVFYLFPQDLPLAVLYPLFFLLYLAGGAPGPVLAVYSKELFDPAMAGTSVGLVNFFPFLGGGVFQVIMGAILEAGGAGTKAASAAAYQSLFGLIVLEAWPPCYMTFFMPETIDWDRDRPA